MSLALKGTLILVGAGKMGGAMLEGWLKSGADPKKVIVLDPFASEEMKALLSRHKVSLNPAIAGIRNAEVVLIAVKPQMMEEVLSSATSENPPPLSAPFPTLPPALAAALRPCRPTPMSPRRR
jgi:pyrroline-5-carboxylate reductase